MENELEIKNYKKEDLENCPKEELIDIVLKQNQLIKIILAHAENQKELLNKYNLARFYSPRDNAYKDKLNELDKPEEKVEKEVKEEKEEKPKSNAGRPTGSKNFSDVDLEELSKENEPIVLDCLDKIPEEEKGLYVKISDEVGYVLEYIPGKLRVRKVIKPKYKKITNEEDKTTIICEPSHSPILNSIVDSTLLADILMMKYGFGVPHYRYVSWFSKTCFPIDTQTLYRWTAGACNALHPLYNTYKERIKEADIIHIDETPIRTIDADNRVNGYIFVFSCKKDNKTYRYYHFSKDRKTSIVDEVIGKDYKGVIVVDGYDGYDRFSKQGINIQRCWVHADRKFKDILKGIPKKEVKNHEANKIVSMFETVFRDEEEINQIGPKTAEERLTLRKDPKRTKHVDDLVAELESVRDNYSDKSLMKEAANYFLNDKESFLLFRKDGRAPIDNNEAERTVKPYALARRNFLFVRGKNGGDCSAIALTMIQNALCNGLEPQGYMNWALSHAYLSNKDDTFDSPNVPEEIKLKYSSKRKNKK